MNYKVGDLVSRISHNNDILFKIISIEDEIAYLKGVDVRLIADSDLDDLEKATEIKEDDTEITSSINKEISLDRNEDFYLPGKILHIDSDTDYLKRCMKLYKKLKIMAYGVVIDESDVSSNINEYLTEIRPNIVVITGHDAYFSKKDDYENSSNFISAIKEARKFEKNQDKLIIIAGACQSNYEKLIQAGANFAYSPKRINIHALDPAIVATCLSFSNKNKDIDIIKILNKTKYGPDGIGGIITKGTMYVGYPR